MTFLKGDYLDFSHLTELENIYLTEIYMKKQHNSSITKNHRIKQKRFFDGVPLKRLRNLLSYFSFCARNKKKSIVGKSSD